jgi:hypothetical protein
MDESVSLSMMESRNCDIHSSQFLEECEDEMLKSKSDRQVVSLSIAPSSSPSVLPSRLFRGLEGQHKVAPPTGNSGEARSTRPQAASFTALNCP